MLASALKRAIPKGAKAALRRSPLMVRHRSRFDNVYHCCVHKTASQWLRHMFADGRVYRYSGLAPHHYEDELSERADLRSLSDRTFDDPFPARTIVTPIYIDFEGYLTIPKPASHRGFFVARDPRDVVVSMYFSWRYSHPLMGDIPRLRKALERISEQDGYRYTIDAMAAAGEFEALASWRAAEQRDPKVKLFRYEDLTGPNGTAHVRTLFDHADVAVPDRILIKVLHDHSFERASGGRAQGQEDPRAHNRMGKPGDWRRRFDGATLEHLERVTGGLPGALGYQT